MSNRSTVDDAVEHFMHGLERRNPYEAVFHQAVREFVETVMPFALNHQKYIDAGILERMTEPDRIIIFRVSWEDDEGHVRANRAWRVQFNNSIGPYKGGLRFHPSVDQSVLKFLGFEQTFKNALTGLPMGGAKGGSNFNPKGKSDREVMRFCQSLMVELHRHIGEDTDVPAGDIGVGQREISYLFGHYKRLENRFSGVLTGKGLAFGGSLIRTEATGYGCVYLTENALNHAGDGIEGKRGAVSGSGNVALFTAEKIRQLGGTVISLSDSGGTVYDRDGIDEEKLAFVQDLKLNRRGRIREYADHFGTEYLEGGKPWSLECDVAFPCATQNELALDDARALLDCNCKVVAEGANMPTQLDAAHLLAEGRVMFLPGKAANAGGVAVSGLEQSQNSLRISWGRDEVDRRLQDIMAGIHRLCVDYGDERQEGGRVGGTNRQENRHVDYVKGANLAAFVKVAEAMLAHGIV